MPTTINADDMIRIEEAAYLMRVTYNSILKYAKDGTLTRYRVGKRGSRFSRQQVEALMRGRPVS